MADEALTAGAVARRLGVAVTTLRTWHQRYGLGPSHHVPGHHRRYTHEDLERLQVMRRLTAQGVTPAEAAAWARRVPIPLEAPPDGNAATGKAPQRPGGGDAHPGGAEQGHRQGVTGQAHHPGETGGALQPDRTGAAQPGEGSQAYPPDGTGNAHHPGGAGRALHPGGTPSGAAEPVSSAGEGKDATAEAEHGRSETAETGGALPRDVEGSGSEAGDVVPLRGGRAGHGRTVDVAWPEFAGSLTVSTRDGGGHTIRTGRAGPAARGLARAAMRLDAPLLRDILEMAVAGRGVVAAWEEVIMPVLIGVGDRYAATRRYIEVEHLLSRSITEVLGAVARPPSGQVPRVLLAAADEELHTLPLEALAAALAEAGVATRFFGARVPTPALIDAVARTGPAAVVLWSQLPTTGDPEQWVRLLASGHAPLLSGAAGPGWPAEGLPDGVVRIGSLQEGVRLVTAAALPGLPDLPTKRAHHGGS